MFGEQNKSKIKYAKLFYWQIELSQYTYGIRHKPGLNHMAPDASSIMTSTNGISICTNNCVIQVMQGHITLSKIKTCLTQARQQRKLIKLALR